MDIYKFNLITYATPPTESCSLPELEQLCEERLQLYKIMDEAHNLDYKPNSAAWDKYVESQVLQLKLPTYITLLKDENYIVGQTRARKNNHIAHWLLSLCYCKTGDLQNFFTNCEIRWFVMLYKRMKDEDLQEFLKENKLEYTHVSQGEKNSLKDKLVTCRPINDVNNTIFYKTHFKDVSNLVMMRKVFLYKGTAYFPKSDLIFCIKNKLLTQFNNQLIWINKILPTNLKDDRMETFLKNIIPVQPKSKRLTDKKFHINLDNIDELADSNFPLCMKTIHSVLRDDHHLKYDCKMQYGLFLKGAGLSYQRAMEFWKDEFTKKMLPEFYDRKYAYLFKHQYGKVGGMIQYIPYSCKKIQELSPGPGQHHGCPFKHWDLDRLLQRCEQDGFTMTDISALKDLLSANKYSNACAKYFSTTHKVLTRGKFMSPNQYFEASYDFEESLHGCLVDIFDECCSQQAS